MTIDVSWWIFAAIGIVVCLLFGWVYFVRKQNFDGALLGLLSLGLAGIGIWVVKPTAIKFPDGTELKLRHLESQVTEIREQLRTYALINIQKKTIIYSTFAPGTLVYEGETGDSKWFPTINFKLKSKPRFVELRSTNGSVVRVLPPVETEGWYQYKGEFTMSNNSDDNKSGRLEDRLVIEAYF